MVLLSPIKEKRDSYLRNQVISSPNPKISFSKKTRRYGQKATPSLSSSASSSPTSTISMVHEPLHFLLPNIPIEKRIESYEEKYRSCMGSRTELSSWIMKNKAKGLPAPLTEDYRPPTRSRFPDFLQGSLSTKPRRGQLKNNRYESIPTKSSISTFLKKATNYSLRPSSSTSTATTINDSTTSTAKSAIHHNNNNNKNTSCRPKRNSQLNISANNTKQTPNRFSFTGSLNRFSLTKTSAAEIEEKYLESNNADYGDRLRKSRSTTRSKKSFESQSRKNDHLADKTNTSKRLSTSVALEAIGEDTDLPKRSHNRLSTPPLDTTRTSSNAFGQQCHKKSRPQSTIIQSPQSSVFLERLLSRSSYPDVLGARPSCQAIQPNVSPKPNHMHQERLSPISSYSTMATSNTIDKDGDIMMEEWDNNNNNRHVFPWKLHGTSSTNTRKNNTPQPVELKRNRLSMIISPSLSIRLSPQKSHFLKRQSMLS